jgi:aminoglycoside 6'-N-acetyltransferase
VTPPAVTLRPLRGPDLDVLLAQPEAGGPPGLEVTQEERRRRLERVVRRSGAFGEGRLDLAVCLDGRLVGRVDARRPEGAMPPGVVEIGIGLFAEARGRGVGRVAVGLLVARLFDEDEIHRVQASTALDNTAMRRVLERAGFAFEGVLRSFMPDGRGGRDDYALYAITRGDRPLGAG